MKKLSGKLSKAVSVFLCLAVLLSAVSFTAAAYGEAGPYAYNLMYKGSEAGVYTNGTGNKTNYYPNTVGVSSTNVIGINKIYFEDGITVGAIPSGNTANTGTLVYSDRVNVVYEEVSSHFTGNNVTVLTPPKNDGSYAVGTNDFFFDNYNGLDGNPAWFSFDISYGATVYIADTYGYGATVPNYVYLGYKQHASTDGLYITTTSRKVASNAFFSKHYKAGETVQIPSYGRLASWNDSTIPYDPPIYIIVWDYIPEPAPTPTPEPTPVPTPESTPEPTPEPTYDPNAPFAITDILYKGQTPTVPENGGSTGSFQYGDIDNPNMNFVHDWAASIGNIPAALTGAKFFTTGGDFASGTGNYLEFTTNKPVIVVGMVSAMASDSALVKSHGWTAWTNFENLDKANYNPDMYAKWAYSRDESKWYEYVIYKEFDAGRVEIPYLGTNYWSMGGGFAVVVNEDALPDPEPVYGDVTGDGKVNTLDRASVIRYIAKWSEYDEDKLDLSAADVTGDGKINALDRASISRHLAKWVGYEVFDSYILNSIDHEASLVTMTRATRARDADENDIYKVYHIREAQAAESPLIVTKNLFVQRNMKKGDTFAYSTDSTTGYVNGLYKVFSPGTSAPAVLLDAINSSSPLFTAKDKKWQIATADSSGEVLNEVYYGIVANVNGNQVTLTDEKGITADGLTFDIPVELDVLMYSPAYSSESMIFAEGTAADIIPSAKDTDGNVILEGDDAELYYCFVRKCEGKVTDVIFVNYTR